MQTSVQITKILSQDDFDSFAKLSGDYNPIHVDPDYASKTRFGKTVAHGAYLVTILRGLTEQLLPSGEQIYHEVKFPAPTYVGEKLQFTASIIKHSANECRVSLQVLRTDEQIISCEGFATIMLKKGRHADR